MVKNSKSFYSFFDEKLSLCPMNKSVFITISEASPLLKYQIASVIMQTESPDELYILDSSGKEENADRIAQMQTQTTFPIEHMCFDPNTSYAYQLNKAIHGSMGDFIILAHDIGFFHPKHIQHHLAFSKRGLFLHGVISKVTPPKTPAFTENFHRVYDRIKSSGSALYFPMLSYFARSKSVFSKEMEIRNVSFWREDFNLINGFDEDFSTLKYAQLDFISRLLQLGIKSKTLQGSGLYYTPNQLPQKDSAGADQQRLLKTLKQKRIVATNGIEKN